jgi:ketosteroid isomerase-like protein
VRGNHAVAALGVAAAAALLALASPSAKDPDFKALQAEVDRAWCTLDARNAAPYYAKNADYVFFDAAPLKYEGWSEYEAGAQKLFLDGAKAMKFIPAGDDHVVRRGDVAWATRTLRISAQMKDGKDLDLNCRDTIVWVREGGKWLIAHEHVSAPLPGV